MFRGELIASENSIFCNGTVLIILNNTFKKFLRNVSENYGQLKRVISDNFLKSETYYFLKFLNLNGMFLA